MRSRIAAGIAAISGKKPFSSVALRKYGSAPPRPPRRHRRRRTVRHQHDRLLVARARSRARRRADVEQRLARAAHRHHVLRRSTIPFGRRKRRVSQPAAALRNARCPAPGVFAPQRELFGDQALHHLRRRELRFAHRQRERRIPPPACTLSSSLLRRVNGWNRISDSSQSVVIRALLPAETRNSHPLQCATRARRKRQTARSGNIETTLRTLPQAIVLAHFESHNGVLIGNLKSFQFVPFRVAALGLRKRR